MKREEIVEQTAWCLVEASTVFRRDQIRKYEEAASKERNSAARWVLETILQNAETAGKDRTPLCDDTGVPHVFVEYGEGARIDAGTEQAMREGIKEGLKRLPGRPMAVRGGPSERIAQSKGLYGKPEALEPAPFVFRPFRGRGLRITVMMLGGGPEIRGRTFRIFHKHDSRNLIEQAAHWAKDESARLGCTPCVPAIGIGRTHYEATVLMLEAMKEGRLDRQSELEKFVTGIVNESGAGALGLGGDTTALGSFIKTGPQRASGVRIVCMRPGCCFDPRRATVVLT